MNILADVKPLDRMQFLANLHGRTRGSGSTELLPTFRSARRDRDV